MTLASHAKGRGFKPLTAQTYRHDLEIHSEERASALIHEHLIDIASLSEISGRSGAFFCSELNPLDRATSPSTDPAMPDQHYSVDGPLYGGLL